MLRWRSHLVLVSLLALLALMGAWYIFLLPEAPPEADAPLLPDHRLRIEGYVHAQTASQAVIDITDGRYLVAVVPVEARPETDEMAIVVEEAMRNEAHDIGWTDQAGKIELKLSEDRYEQPNLVVFMEPRSREAAGYVEILRQSEADLKRLYDFDKPGGYSLVGRTDLSLPQIETPITEKPRRAVELGGPFPDLAAHYPPDSYPQGVREAISIVQYIWSEPLRLGPSHADAEYMQISPLKRMEALRGGQWSAQCAAIRGIFVDLAAASPYIGEVREVGLYQYYPPYPDLITNSHAVAEIYDKTLGKWIMIDAHHASVFRVDGKYLNAADLQAMTRAERAAVEVLNFVEDRAIDKLEGYLSMEDSYYIYFGTIAYRRITAE